MKRLLTLTIAALLLVLAAATAAPERIVALPRRLVHEPFRLNSAFAQTLVIGALVGRLERARALVRSMRRSVAQARRGIGRHPTVMLILGVGRTPFVFLPNSWGGDMIVKAGGRLLTGGVELGLRADLR